MTPIGQKRLSIGLSVVVVVLAILAAWGWARAGLGELDAILTDSWTGMLLEGRDAVLEKTNVAEVALDLRWVGRWNRPPQPPPPGIERHHYNLMERTRVAYQRDIVIHLRHLTSDPLGDDPKLWTDKYAKPER